MLQCNILASKANIVPTHMSVERTVGYNAATCLQATSQKPPQSYPTIAHIASAPNAKLPTHKASLAQVRFMHNMAALTDTSACNTLTPCHANMCIRGAYPKHDMNMCQILMQPIPPLCCRSSCVGPHTGFAQRAYRVRPY